MAPRTRIELQTTRHLTTGPELALVQAAYARSASAAMRSRLAALMAQTDDFDGVIALLHGESDLAIGQEMLLASAWLTRKSAEGDRHADAATLRALAAATDPADRSKVLAMRARIETRRREIDAARATLAEALALDPCNKDACRRLTAIELDAGNPGALLALADHLTARGARYTQLLVAQVLANARLGDIAAARDLVGGALFRHAERLTPPEGWDSTPRFNRALAEELLAHPAKRYTRYGTASELSWRIDAPLTRSAPLVGLLMARIAAAIDAHVARIADSDHVWAQARPQQAVLHSSCVITDEEGFESWHAHPNAWLSGAYYVRVPEAVGAGTDERGCIAFGLPEDLAGDRAAAEYGVEVIRPQAGLLLLFPSHSHHRTFPHGRSEPRICVSFDLRAA